MNRFLLATLLFSSTALAKPTVTAKPLITAPIRVALAEHVTSAEQDTAKQLEAILRGPLRNGVTGLLVVDAHTGEPVFSVNADEPLNPASNVKMISTATALELLGPDFKYPTRLLGPRPDVHGAVRGDAFLLGSYDPTLVADDYEDIAHEIAAQGIIALHGDILIGDHDSTRDGMYRAIVPIEVTGGKTVGAIATAHGGTGNDLFHFNVTAKTVAWGKPKLTYKTKIIDDHGHPRLQVDIGGTIAKNAVVPYKLPVNEARALAAAHALRAALKARGVIVTGDVRVASYGDFLGTAIGRGDMPDELGHHESKPLADIVTIVNKWSINWLADRVVMTAAALTRSKPPSMDLAIDEMYAWLDKHAKLERKDLVVDTGSGLSYKTRITPRELVAIFRNAGGFASETAMDETSSKAWLSSLSVAGHDGTLARRFLAPDIRGRIHGKTGTLSNAIALSGVVEIDPQRPLIFSLVTNTKSELSKPYVRKTHEQLVTALARYAERTAKHAAPPAILDAAKRTPALPDALAAPGEAPIEDNQ